MLRQRVILLRAAFAGHILACLTGMIVDLHDNFPLASWIAACVFPTAACLLAGLKHYDQLAKIAVFSAIGCGLTMLLAPAISESAQSRSRRVAADSFAGKSWHIPCHAVAALMTGIGIGFIPAEQLGAGKPRTR